MFDRLSPFFHAFIWVLATFAFGAFIGLAVVCIRGCPL